MEDCSICLESIKENEYKLSCGHLYHKNCILAWYFKKAICPLCRSVIKYTDIENDLYEPEDFSETEDYGGSDYGDTDFGTDYEYRYNCFYHLFNCLYFCINPNSF